MMQSDFIWTDLSTFDLAATKSFYATLFGWSYSSVEGYELAYARRELAAGVYTMPDRFQAINMPSFWMPYIAVDDAQAAVDLAAAHGGRVEIKPIPFQGDDLIALIRDPLGAGFTVWQGATSSSKHTAGAHGRMLWNELFVSDAAAVMPFYEALFGWRFERVAGYEGERYEIFGRTSPSPIAALEVMPDTMRGKEQYWTIFFGVNDLSKAAQHVMESGGQSLGEYDGAEGRVALMRDPQGAMFVLAQAGGTPSPASNWRSWFKPRTLLGLIAMYCAVIFNWTWMWGLLFLVWVLPDLQSGETYLAEPIRRAENPIWYWSIVGTFLWMSVYLLLDLFY